MKKWSKYLLGEVHLYVGKYITVYIRVCFLCHFGFEIGLDFNCLCLN